MIIRPMETADLATVTDIYNHYILHTTSSYHEQPIAMDEMREKYQSAAVHGCFLVAEGQDGNLAGFAFADLFRAQSAWRLLESTIYLAPGSQGKGTGGMLYGRLIAEVSQKRTASGIVAMITMDNKASIGFHESFGFLFTGKWEGCAFKFGRWLSTGSWYYRLATP